MTNVNLPHRAKVVPRTASYPMEWAVGRGLLRPELCKMWAVWHSAVGWPHNHPMSAPNVVDRHLKAGAVQLVDTVHQFSFIRIAQLQHI